MPIRRHCDPINVKKIWDAIRSANMAHQVCDMNRILKFVQKTEDCTQAQAELYINQAVKDKLILPSRKGTVDATNQTYKMAEQELPDFDGKDWYCFECHLAGEVNICANCFRTFHTDCVKTAKRKFDIFRYSTSLKLNNTSAASSDYSLDASDFNLGISTNSSQTDKSASDHCFNERLCSVCNIVNIDDCKLDKTEMNYLLKFVLHRIRAWLPNTITHTMAEEDRPSWLTDSELTWRANQLFFEHRDMSVIEVNLNTEHYNILSEFLADILTVKHNVAIFHGIASQEYQAAEFMVRDTFHDIRELKNCSDCYKHSNEKINLRWFTLPCRNPHKLVWAKQKGYPYWPAKVIQDTASHCDVRFFGGKHERALIHKSFVKHISVSKESLKIKSSAAFTKALEELIYHQKLLSDPQELERLLAECKPKKPTKKTISPIGLVTNTHRKKEKQPANGKPGNNASTSKRKLSNIGRSESTERNKSKEELDETESTERKKCKGELEETSSEVISGNVINISDCEEEETDYSFRRNSISQDSFRFDESFEQVSSSTENYKNDSNENDLHQLDQPYSDSVEKMRRQLETLPGRAEMIKCAMECMQTEIDRITNEHNDHLKRLFESHNAQISETKKKQWCYNCEQDAIYHCCWNTAYCSQTCQQQHWQAEHKKVCRRKRQT